MNQALIIQYIEGRRYYYAGDETFIDDRASALLVPYAEVARLVECLTDGEPAPCHRGGLMRVLIACEHTGAVLHVNDHGNATLYQTDMDQEQHDARPTRES